MKDELDTFVQICKNGNGSLEQIYWSKKPTVSLYYLILERTNDCGKRAIKKQNVEISAMKETEVTSFFKGIKVKNISNSKSLKKMILDVFLKQNIIYEANEKIAVRNNMEALVENEALVAVAKKQIKYMCEIKALTHRSKDDKSLKIRLKRENFFGINIGENIAKQQGSDYEEVAKMWIKSEEHKKNILGDFTFTGVSTCKDSQSNRYWIQIFSKGISNKQLPNYQDYRMLNKYIDDGYSPQMENDKYVILLKPTDSEQDGDQKDIGEDNIKPNNNDRLDKSKRATSILDISDRKRKDFGYGIIDQSQSECTDSRHCQPEVLHHPKHSELLEWKQLELHHLFHPNYQRIAKCQLMEIL
ncbi:unnamed protein product [Medioppia subpectinata]|uniref:SCP domain-containing protein n=1 Tax=Medioppia subpectinata TaxID=1979941 RepID=A0A7R9KCF1_9ACAR|nr:unnamed protein product [Medioppia subpectinata]CAG2100636.1 unnamed protein product [Medioppia subpectinata]